MTPASPPVSARRAELLGVPIDRLTLEQVLDRVNDAIRDRSRLRIGVVNAAKVVNMRRNRVLRHDVLSSNLILADGAGVVWAGRLLGDPLPERVAGIDLMRAMLHRGSAAGWKFFFLGATREVLEQAVTRIRADHPGVRVVGCRDGYFAAEEEAGVAQQIREAQPDVLFVAMTSPKKERFLAAWSDRLEVPVWHGVGGSLDVVSGRVRRAPLGWQRLGLEWLYRLLQEPRRLWRRYLVTNALFGGLLLGEAFRRGAARLARR